ncbi:MAG: hypothetical protein PVG39_24630 [Desulfobacteraceae bacterium]|jgi:hypothetical protein
MLKKGFDFQFARYFLVFVLIVLVNGCMKKDNIGSGFSGLPIESDKIVFLGFKPALSTSQEPVIFHNPMTGGSVSSEPLSQSLADIMSDKMYTLLIDSKDYEFINLREIKNLTDPALYEKSSSDGIEIIQSIGKAVSADVALTGYLYRMHERVGSEHSASSPASVAFDVYLISVKDGSFLWKGSYNKTQKSLSENLLDFKSFLKFKRKWVDANTLAEIGLKELIDKMPLKNK